MTDCVIMVIIDMPVFVSHTGLLSSFPLASSWPIAA